MNESEKHMLQARLEGLGILRRGDRIIYEGDEIFLDLGGRLRKYDRKALFDLVEGHEVEEEVEVELTHYQEKFVDMTHLFFWTVRKISELREFAYDDEDHRAMTVYDQAKDSMRWIFRNLCMEFMYEEFFEKITGHPGPLNKAIIHSIALDVARDEARNKQ